MSILERINSSQDIKKLDENELQPLCGELREFIIENVSRNGGHLASNLGVVELSVALHRVYDTQKDRIVFDVGHQCYAHKIITGRREGFSSLRKKGGVSGFILCLYFFLRYGFEYGGQHVSATAQSCVHEGGLLPHIVGCGICPQ